MSKKDRNRVCPAELAGGLDNKIRRLFQNPVKILKPYVKEGMNVFELGCGPGFFTPAIAGLAGNAGSVIAADLQEKMLDILRDKIRNTEFEKRITPHKCGKNSIDYHGGADFVFAFYVIHEIPDKERLFTELYSILSGGGRMLIIEPPFHVTGEEFRKMTDIITGCGFRLIKQPRMFPNKAVLFEKTV
ncbi:MAG: class I SAM-dependent methyltransferase [Bacteroidetes bacterium]|nr:class I SAM-dependent methyltransferase [Bacteroidota bacterium]